MDVDNLTKDKFTELVDNMLEIVYSDNIVNNNVNNNFNNISVIRKANNILEALHIKKFIESKHSFKYSLETKGDYLYKFFPYNNEESLINSDIILNKKICNGLSSNSEILNNKQCSGSSTTIPGILNKKYFKFSIGRLSSTNLDRILFGYIFEYFLYNLIKKPNYLCKIYEIGKYESLKFYSIMDICGKNIFNFFFKVIISPNGKEIDTLRINIKYKNNEQLNILFNNLLIIFYKMILCVKILHDLGYVHLDIKPENFLISTIDETNLLELIFKVNIENIVLVRIIDFELVRKIDEEITIPKYGIGTKKYTNTNLLPGKKRSRVTISPKYDITPLIKSFIYMIGIIFLDSSDYKSEKINIIEKFNDTIIKILTKLKEINTSKSSYNLDKLGRLIEILDKKTDYTNIDFLLNAFYCLLYNSTPINFNEKIKLSNSSVNNINTIKSILAQPNSSYSIIDINDYYFLWHKVLLNIESKNISSKLYIEINPEKDKQKNDLIIQNEIKELLTKYLLPVQYIITGYFIDGETENKTKITYFRKINNQKYITLKNYFHNIFDKIKNKNNNNQYIILTHVLHIFSLIMECIKLFEYFPDYGLNVSLDNFVIAKNTSLFTLDIDLKIAGGIVNIKIDTQPIEMLGNCMFDILSKFSFFNSNEIQATNSIKVKLKKLKNIKTQKEQSFFKKIIKPITAEDYYRTDLCYIIEIMIFPGNNSNTVGVIDIKNLINIFNEIRKNITSKYFSLESILSNLVKIKFYISESSSSSSSRLSSSLSASGSSSLSASGPSAKIINSNNSKNLNIFYKKNLKNFIEKPLFILENIYKILCEIFISKDSFKTNPKFIQLINTLKRINFLQNSFIIKKKNNSSNKTTNDLKDEDLFKKIKYKNFKQGKNYFYSPDKESILYFGKLEKINKKAYLFISSFEFKYYILEDDICKTTTLTVKELEGIYDTESFYEFK